MSRFTSMRLALSMAPALRRYASSPSIVGSKSSHTVLQTGPCQIARKIKFSNYHSSIETTPPGFRQTNPLRYNCPLGSFENTCDQKRARPPPIPVSNTSTRFASKADPKIRTVINPRRHTEAIRSPVRPRQTTISPAGREQASQRSDASPGKSPVRWHHYRAE